MKKNLLWTLLLLAGALRPAAAQLLQPKPAAYTRADSLRGRLTHRYALATTSTTTTSM